MRRRLLLLAALAGTGCFPRPPAQPEHKPAQTLNVTLKGKQVTLELDACTVYQVQPDGKRKEVLTTEFYLGPTACTRQSLSVTKDGVVEAELGRTALGAGGCCAAGGTYRSRDGVRWEKSVGEGKWKKVEN